MQLNPILEKGYSYKENSKIKGSVPYKMGSFNCSLSFSSFSGLSAARFQKKAEIL